MSDNSCEGGNQKQRLTPRSAPKIDTAKRPEKDFWVCWLLAILFESPFAEHLVYKGGTSLSKVFDVIERFSEDIDLSLSPAFLGLPEPGLSRHQANKWMAQAEAACGVIAESLIRPTLESSVTKALGRREGCWFEFLTDANTHSPVLLFHYPSSQSAGFDYLKRSVKLEFGSLTDQQPIGRHPIRPWIADAFPDWQCDVVALELERTLWEKATILHAEYHRPIDKPTPDRFSRHYGDTAALAKHPISGDAVRQRELRARVVEWKTWFFGSSWANYDDAKPRTFRLVPADSRQPALRRDYLAMRDMYLTEPATFDDILAILADLENGINHEGG
jgi:hypothetical protein